MPIKFLRNRIHSLIISIFLCTACLNDIDRFDPLDSLSPKTHQADALTLPLQTVTISTSSLQHIKKFYVDGLDLSLTGPISISAQTKEIQRSLWAIPKTIDWAEYHLTRPNAAVNGRPAMSIRVLVLDQETPLIRSNWDARALGGFSMGFPNHDQDKLDQKIRELNFDALNTIEKYNVPRTDGTLYTIHETIFNAPDFVHAVGINRLGMAPLGAVDDATGIGGPGYSAQIIRDSDKVLAFYTDVLGLELRRDSIWKSAGQDGAMNLPNGTKFRFSIIFAKGYGPGGHMLFVDFINGESIDSGILPAVPNRGIGMWSYPVTNMSEVLERATAFGTEIIQHPLTYTDPLHGNIRVATLRAPNGFLIEIYEEN